MIVVFHPDLYSDYFTFADDECAPEWNPEYEFWVLSMVKNCNLIKFLTKPLKLKNILKIKRY